MADQVLWAVEVDGDLRHAQYRQRRIEQAQRLGIVPGAVAELDGVVEALGGQVDTIIVGGQPDLQLRMLFAQ